MDLKDRLKNIYNLTDQELALTIDQFVPEVLPAKRYFLKEGQISDRLAFIRSGLLRSFIYNDNADEITTHFFNAGKVLISMESFNGQKPSKEYIVAIEDSELLVATYDKMQQLIEKVPVWRQIIKDVDEFKFNEQMNRSIRFQTLSATERYEQLLQNNPEIVQKVALRHIASYLGIDIATLSRIRKKI